MAAVGSLWLERTITGLSSNPILCDPATSGGTITLPTKPHRNHEWSLTRGTNIDLTMGRSMHWEFFPKYGTLKGEKKIRMIVRSYKARPGGQAGRVYF